MYKFKYFCSDINQFLNGLKIIPVGGYSSVGSNVARESRGTAINTRVRYIFSRRFGHEIISTAILPLSLIQKQLLSVNGESCALSTGYQPRGGLPRNSVHRRITGVTT